MKKKAFILMIITTLSKVLGFIKYIVLAYFYGASNVSDAYLIAMTIPMIIFDFIGNGISNTFIPLYTKVLKNNNEKLAKKFISNLINVMLFIATLIVIFSFIFTPQIVKIFAFGFDGETFKLATILTRILILGIYFKLLNSILKGYLYVNNKYYIPQIVGFPFNIIIIITIISSSVLNNEILLAYGSLFAFFIEFLIIAIYSFVHGFKYHLIFNIRDNNLREMLYLSVPVVITTSVKDLNRLIDRTISSLVAVGGISALSYAARLNQFIQQIFVGSIVTIIFPTITKIALEKNNERFKKILVEAIISINLIILPASVGILYFSQPIIEFLFNRGQFDIKALNMTSSALFFYSVGIPGFALREVLSKAYFSLGDTKTPMKISMITIFLNIFLNVILSKYLGIGGLALATSLSGIVSSLLMFHYLKSKVASLNLKLIILPIIKILIVSIFMGFISRSVYNLLSISLSINSNIALIIAIIVGVFVYLVIIYFVKIDEVDILVKGIKKRLSKTR